MPAKLILMSEPPKELVDDILDSFVKNEIEDFICQIELARRSWRKYRALVESPKFPKGRVVLAAMNVKTMRQLRERLRPRAARIAESNYRAQSARRHQFIDGLAGLK